MLKKLLYRRTRRRTLAEADEAASEKLRARGVKVGKGCRIYTREFSTEPYLVELADGVAISQGAKFLTHDGAARLLRHRRPAVQHFGRIVVGTDTFIGENAIILPGTRIGAYCVIGAGAVVRGVIPDNSLVVGNPATIVGRASTYLERPNTSPRTLDTFGMEEPARRELILAQFAGEEKDAGT